MEESTVDSVSWKLPPVDTWCLFPEQLESYSEIACLCQYLVVLNLLFPVILRSYIKVFDPFEIHFCRRWEEGRQFHSYHVPVHFCQYYFLKRLSFPLIFLKSLWVCMKIPQQTEKTPDGPAMWPNYTKLGCHQRLQVDIQQKHCSIYCSTHITVTIWNQLRQPVIVEQLK